MALLIGLILLLIITLIIESKKRSKKEEVELIFIPNDNIDKIKVDEKELFDKVNKFRVDNKRTPLISDSFLYYLANLRNDANTLIDGISHENIGVIINKANKYNLKISENLGYNYYNTDTVLTAWINSDSHRENMLEDWKYTGIAILKYKDNKYYCQVFGK